MLRKRAVPSFLKLKMRQQHTALLEYQTKETEELGAGPEFFGPGPFLSFLDRFYHHFHSRTRPSFQLRARQYVSGLFQLSAKRNIERIDRMVAGSQYDSSHHFISCSPWDDAAVCAQVTRDTDRLLGGPDACLIIDPSGFPKKGRMSVGVAPQYCGNTGKIDNCQVGVFSALARGRDVSLINKRLFLPQAWCQDGERCDKAGIPAETRGYKNRGELALELVADADQHGARYGWIGLDAEFGKPWILDRLSAMGKCYLVDVASTYRVHLQHPGLRVSRPLSCRADQRLSLRKKAVPVASFITRRGRGKWRRRVIRDSTKGPLIADFLHTQVWLGNEKGLKPQRERKARTPTILMRM